MWALVTGKAYTEYPFGTGPIVNWATRIMGHAAPVVLDILLLVLVAGVALLIIHRRSPVRKLARARRRDLARRR